MNERIIELLERIAVALENKQTATTTNSKSFDPTDRDINGRLWNGRIHASTRTKTQKGEWKIKRGVNELLIEKVQNELDEEAKTFRSQVNVVEHIKEEQNKAQEFLGNMQSVPVPPVETNELETVSVTEQIEKAGFLPEPPVPPVEDEKPKINNVNDLVAIVTAPNSGLDFQKLMDTAKVCGYESIQELATNDEALKNVSIALGLA